MPTDKKIHFMDSNYPRNLLVRFYPKVLFYIIIFVSSNFFGMDKGEVRGERDQGLAKSGINLTMKNQPFVRNVISDRDTNYESPWRQKNHEVFKNQCRTSYTDKSWQKPLIHCSKKSGFSQREKERDIIFIKMSVKIFYDPF